jgi:hypothetical protein
MLLTSKGEPTLWPDDISMYLRHLVLRGAGIPFLELQTNAILFTEQEEKFFGTPGTIADDGEVTDPRPGILHEWYNLGLTTIAISVVSIDNEENRQNYVPHRDEYPDLGTTIDRLHEIGFSVRLCFMLVEGLIDSIEKIEGALEFAKEHSVEQVTARPIFAYDGEDGEVFDWTMANTLPKDVVQGIYDYFLEVGTQVMTLPHGAPVLDVNGQNLCLTDCLTVHPEDPDEVRQIIFFPDGHIRYAWQYEGAILL